MRRDHCLRVAVFCAAGLVITNAGAQSAPGSEGGARTAFLVVGDTGEPLERGAPTAAQLAVGEAMAREDQARPVDGLLFLGDNFYPDGLVEDELLERVRGNLLLPYCHFAAAAASRSPMLGACEAFGERHSVPWFAVPGNHDHSQRQSVRLQSERIPALLPNWRMSTRPVTVFDVAGGVSLIALDSMTFWRGSGDPMEVVEALKTAPGPWRILLTHRPLGSAESGGYTEKTAYRRYREEIGNAISESGVPVHLVLSGHDHYLAATSVFPDRALLNAIAGSGSTVRNRPIARRGLMFRESRLGFARVDVEGEHLDVTLVAVGRRGPSARVACFRVGLGSRFAACPPESIATR